MAALRREQRLAEALKIERLPSEPMVVAGVVVLWDQAFNSDFGALPPAHSWQRWVEGDKWL